MAFSLISAAGLVAALASPAYAAITLTPKNHGLKIHNVVPSHEVTMQYGGAHTSYVNVSLSTTHPAIQLENLATVSSVDCDDYSVSVRFNSSAAFQAAAAEWTLAEPGDNSAATNLLFITNHLGDCDAELERGFFLANSIAADNRTLTILAKTTKQKLNETASDMAIDFKGLPQVPTRPSSTGNSSVVASRTRRDIHATPSLSIDHTLSLPPTVLFRDDPLTFTIDEATLSATATITGSIRYHFFTAKLKEFTLDFDTSVSTELGFDLLLTEGFNSTHKTTMPAIEFDALDVPGILRIGPEIVFALGLAMDISGSVGLHGKVGASIPQGTVHIDAKDQSKSYANGWTPQLTHSFNIAESITASVDPFVEVTFALAIKVLEGLLDFSVGLKAQPRFHNAITARLTQPLGGTAAVPAMNGTAIVSATNGTRAIASRSSSSCPNGIEVLSEFQFSLIAVLTQFYEATLFTVKKAIDDQCFSL